MEFKIDKETPFKRKMVKLIEEENNMLVRRQDVRQMLGTYFRQRTGEKLDKVYTYADLMELLNDLPEYNLQGTVDRMKEKRYWDAAKIAEDGWK